MADRFRTGPDWADIRVFVALARYGSLSATARALRVNHATVARRLAGLEQALGAKLFERRPTGYVLTAAGRQALEPGPRQTASGCTIEMMVPQIMLERGGLATRSLRLFGVIRRYENGSLVSGYSGYAASPMPGFQIKSPADADSATTLVELAYRSAITTLLRNSTKPKRK